MSAQSDRRLIFAETCRSRAAATCSPFQRKHLLVLARLSDFEAGGCSIHPTVSRKAKV